MTRSYDNMKRMETEFDQESSKSWLSSMLPSERNDIMNIIYSCKLSRNKTTTRKFDIWKLNYNVLIPPCRSEYFQTLKHCFSLLFSKDWLSLEVPDLYSVLVSQPHIKIDSPTTDEEIQKILNRFSQASLTSNGHHMTHAQIYSAILDVIIQVREERKEKRDGDQEYSTK